MKRALAVLGALVLIGGALFVRTKVGGDDGGGSDGPGRTDPTATVVGCTEDLMAVCDALVAADLIADDPPTIDLAGAVEPADEVDGWITWDPAPGVANAAAEVDGAPTPWSETVALGSARRSALFEPRAYNGLVDACTKVDWACIAERAGPATGIGVGRVDTAEGLARILPLAFALAPDGDYQQLDDVQLEALLDSPSLGQADTATMATQLATVPGASVAVVGPRPALEAAAATTQGRSRSLRVVTPSTAGEMTALVATRTGRDLGEVSGWCEVDEVAAALTELGLQPCQGEPDDRLAGFLYQVREKVG